jgi:hypothetical protein
MKKIFFLFSIALIVSFLSSCHKEPEFSSVEGYVREWKSNKAIPNARIRIQECQGEFLGSFSCSDIDTIYSDANGYYKYYKEFVGEDAHKSGWNTYLVVSKEKYSTYQVEDYAMPIRGTRIKDMILLPNAWLKLHVKAVNQYDTDDYIKIGELDGSQGTAGFKGINQVGEYVKVFPKIGNDSITIYWWIDKDDVIKNYQQKIYLPALDTTEFKLFF